MKKLGIITSLALVAFLAVSVVPAGAQTSPGTTASVTEPAPNGTPAPVSVTTNLNLIPSLAPTPTPAASLSSDSYHRFEVYAGYAFLSNDISVVDDGEFQQLDHGYAASAKFNLNRNFGILADFSGNNGSQTFGTADRQRQDQYYFLFGPEISHEFGKARISGHITAGVAKQHYGDIFSDGSDHFKETNFAAGVGGAFDWMFSDHWGWRVLQFDYLMSLFDGGRLNNFRGSTGIIVRFK